MPTFIKRHSINLTKKIKNVMSIELGALYVVAQNDFVDLMH